MCFKEYISQQTGPMMLILIGIPASGKSTFARLECVNMVRINLDTLHRRHKEEIAIRDAIDEHKNLVIDNTNVTVADRKRYIDIAKVNGYATVGVYFKSSIRECLARNEKREGKARIPQSGVLAKYSQLELPACSEGFDKLFHAELSENGFKISDWEE